MDIVCRLWLVHVHMCGYSSCSALVHFALVHFLTWKYYNVTSSVDKLDDHLTLPWCLWSLFSFMRLFWCLVVEYMHTYIAYAGFVLHLLGNKLIETGQLYVELNILDVGKIRLGKDKLAFGVIVCSQSTVNSLPWQECKTCIGQWAESKS